jgi:hypothetical protein
MAVRRTAVAVLAILAMAGCGPGGSGRADPAYRTPVPPAPPQGGRQALSSQNLAYLWPLTVERGTIECRDATNAVFVAPDATAYALNDDAMKAGYPSIEPLRARGADSSPISLGALRSRALGLCHAGG